MAYSTCARVAALIPNLLNGASDFDDLDTQVRPGSAALIQFMTSGCALINSVINARGFSTPGATNAIYDYLGDIESNYAAYRAELARANPRTAMGERNRADQFKKSFDAGMDFLRNENLGLLGFTKASAQWYVGGTSETEKDSVESDTDRVVPRFSRGQFNNDDAVDPQTSAS